MPIRCFTNGLNISIGDVVFWSGDMQSLGYGAINVCSKTLIIHEDKTNEIHI